ncbi:MAG TPA: segregation/condensation protein A [Candidatus Limnocylindrales bacterium]|nr:segregation/condensation protein A [Candidatus Limnocylindrales bacterium]
MLEQAAGAGTLALGLDGAPSVRIEPGRGRDWATHVRIAEWEGPLGLLLSLIEARRLDVLDVPLGGLAEAYLEALATIEHDRMTTISAFVAVASQLILIKSRAMLPRPPALPEGTLEDEGLDPEAELRARLLLYRAFRDAGAALQAGAIERVGLFRREPAAALASGLAGATAAPTAAPADPRLLVRSLDSLVRVLPEPEPPPEVVPRTITLTQRASIIRLALRGASSIVLQDLLQGVRDKVVVAVTFLAMLELMKRREVVVEQEEPFGPITARRTTAEERLAAGLAAEADEAPLDESLESFA